jgi:hypothetical protein
MRRRDSAVVRPDSGALDGVAAEGVPVHPAVVAHPDDSAQDRSRQGEHGGHDHGDDAAGGQAPRVDGHARQPAELPEHVELAAGHQAHERQDDGDDDRPQPHGQAPSKRAILPAT